MQPLKKLPSLVLTIYDAISYLDRAKSLSPSRLDIDFLRCIILYKENKLQECSENLNTLVEKNSKDIYFNELLNKVQNELKK